MNHVTDPAPSESLWTPEDVAKYLKVSKSWVYQQAERGVLPSKRFCRHLRFDPQEIRDFVTAKSAEVIPIRTTTED